MHRYVFDFLLARIGHDFEAKPVDEPGEPKDKLPMEDVIIADLF